jgi:hypothetical protein
MILAKIPKRGGYMMNTLVRLMLVCMLMLGSMLMIGAAPAYSAEAVHVYWCEEGDNVTEEQIEALASRWLKAAKTMKGGEQLKAYLYYPIAAKLPGKTDLFFLVVAPSAAAWGAFWDGYKNSPAEKVDMDNRDLVICTDSALMESVEVK